MSIDKVELINITVFKKLTLNMSSGINIIIGENGTGKTHLLKMIYFAYSDREYTLEQKYIRKYNNKENYQSNVIITYDKNRTCWIKADGEKSRCENKKDPIYIPVSEMLSHSKGFLALNSKYKMPFDPTEIDIISDAELPETREISKINKVLLKKISDIIDGEVIYENDTFYVMKKEGFKVEFSVEAEGLRKFGLLFKLLRNGLIENGTVLLWDEPEANINPELIPILVDVLLELQSEGVQIFISTHSYNLAKYFEVKKNEVNQVLFHSLYKNGNEVSAHTEKYFGKLNNNKIISADEKLLDEVLQKNLED
ncbi:AAA family ATPase [Clostridium tyrobutyricum]|uniref:AAA family ATPase n=1 Tax=Clostridium tyrobutyricum TaxID=1519 RepID=UPI0002DE1672|nr:AAA family ATPase [Clostridium tyrobutyricum]MEA5010033.1 AAA family ATPase [Clostridium tyrobutyricum]